MNNAQKMNLTLDKISLINNEIKDLLAELTLHSESTQVLVLFNKFDSLQEKYNSLVKTQNKSHEDQIIELENRVNQINKERNDEHNKSIDKMNDVSKYEFASILNLLENFEDNIDVEYSNDEFLDFKHDINVSIKRILKSQSEVKKIK